MFKKKKEKTKDTIAVMQLKKLENQFLDISWDLSKAVESIIIKQGVISLYLDGADKEKAIKDCHYAKSYLLALIGKYDDLRNQIKEFVEKTKEKRKTTLDYKVPVTSHERIEQIYKIKVG